jgi:hypothetical protein
MNDVNCPNSSHVDEPLNNCEELVSAIHGTIQDLELELIWLKSIVETYNFEKALHTFQIFNFFLKNIMKIFYIWITNCNWHAYTWIYLRYAK